MGRQVLSEAQRLEILRLRSAGASWAEIVVAVGCLRDTARRVVWRAGGIAPRPRVVSERYLSLRDREEISRGLAAGWSFAQIARALARPTSTVSREVGANGGRRRYRACAAQRRADRQARRPKPAKLATNAELRAQVEAGLRARFSPTQIAHRLRHEFPDRPEMWVSHETIYQSLFVQGRGALRKELTACLRSGRANRRPPRRGGSNDGRIKDMVMISDRPAEIEDRAVPGHWEGDLLIGARGRSAIATLVERSTRYVMLIKIADQRAETVRKAIAEKITTLPEHLRRSLTWDQGKEMAQHAKFTIDTGIPVFFCDPHSPWQRGSNENTNGLLRQYFPKGTDLSTHSQEQLDQVAYELNRRPRQTLEWYNPAERLNDLLVATTT